MQHRKLAEQFFAERREFQQDFTAIVLTRPAHDRTPVGQSVHKLNRAVMAKAQPRCYCSNGWARSFRQPLDCQQKLMLLRLNTAGSRSLFTEMKKLANAIP